MVQYSKAQAGDEKRERVILEKAWDCGPPASPGHPLLGHLMCEKCGDAWVWMVKLVRLLLAKQQGRGRRFSKSQESE